MSTCLLTYSMVLTPTIVIKESLSLPVSCVVCDGHFVSLCNFNVANRVVYIFLFGIKWVFYVGRFEYWSCSVILENTFYTKQKHLNNTFGNIKNTKRQTK